VWGGAGAAPTGVVSTTYQPLDADLTAIAGLTVARGSLIRGGAAAWEAVALGATGGLLSSDGTDAIWLARVSGTSAIDFASLPDGACLESAFALTGAALGDAMAFGASVALPTGVVGTARVSALNTAQIQVCNLSGAAVDLAITTFTARVVR